MCSFCSQAAFQSGNTSAEMAAGANGNQATGQSNPFITGNNNIDGLLSGLVWGTTSLTWRIPGAASDYDTDPRNVGIQYGDMARVNTWLAPTASMFTATAQILNEQFAAVSQLRFTMLAGANTAADLTIGRATSTADFQTAYAHYPWGPGAGLSGDSWFSTSYDTWGNASSYATPTLGGYNWYTYLHEFGHNMGLKHGHEIGGVNNVAMNADRDSSEFSVMTYRSHIGSDPAGGATNERWGFAQSLMMYDIAALQVMYGANFTENASATVYTFSTTTGEMFVNGVGEGTPGGNKIFRTVWDGNGVDTYDLSNYSTNLNIDLTPGGWSVFSTTQLANLGQGFVARGNLFNALQFNGDIRSLIENAIGGSGADIMRGNQADNTLSGGHGSDTIYGGSGGDTIYGGVSSVDLNEIGADMLYGENGDDFIYGNGGSDTIIGGLGADFLIGGTGNDFIVGGLSITDTTDLADDFIRGGDGNDTIYGNGGADTVLGGTGLDTVFGGEGDDILYGGVRQDVADLADTIYGGNGNDDIRGNFGDDMLYGEAGNDIIIGGNGQDTIFGGFGNDTLRGGEGSDIFVFNTALNASTNVDTILSFSTGDSIWLSRTVFGGLGATFDEAEFCTGEAADNASHRIIYNDATGQLYYDADGNGASAQVQFALLDPALPVWYNNFAMTA